MPEPVVTHDIGDRRRKMCRCSKCGVERLCTPSFDFYASRRDDNVPEGNPLVCERCFRSNLVDRSINVDGLPPFEN